MKTSPAGVALIKKFEGCRLEAYQDVVGVWTIGYGDTLNVRPATRITQQQAEARLANRLANEFEPGVLTGIGNTMATQPQFDAMISLSWNIGIGAFEKSSVARLHRAGDYAAAADAFRLWNKAGGQVLDALVRRREEERALYLSDAAASPGRDDPPADILAADYLVVLQAFMRASGDYTGDLDGFDGPLTRAAVAAIQKRAQTL